MEELFRITNYYDHPTDNRYLVIHYFKKEQADKLTGLLEENKITFESVVEQHGKKTIYLFGVHKKHRKQAEHLNFFVIGKTREPFINHKGFRYFILILLFVVLIFTIIGLVYSNK